MGKKKEVQYYIISNKEPIANANADYCIQSFSRSLLPTFDTPNNLDRTNNCVRETDKGGKRKIREKNSSNWKSDSLEMSGKMLSVLRSWNTMPGIKSKPGLQVNVVKCPAQELTWLQSSGYSSLTFS